jgi:hypothetical protein
MRAIFKKWKFLIISGMVIVFFAYTFGPTVEFILKYFHSVDHSQVQRNPHWQHFTNQEAGYIVEFPSRPFEYHDSDDKIDNPAAVSFHRFISVLGTNDCFMVSTVEDSFTNHFTDDQVNLILDTTMKGALGSDGKLLAKRNVMLGKYAGREIEFQKSDKFYMKSQYYKVGNKLQTLMVTVPFADQQIQTSNTLYFFNSFRLISN